MLSKHVQYLKLGSQQLENEVRFFTCNDAGKACGSATGAGGRKSSHCLAKRPISSTYLDRHIYKLYIYIDSIDWVGTRSLIFIRFDLWIVLPFYHDLPEETSGLQLSWVQTTSTSVTFFVSDWGFVATLLKEVQQVGHETSDGACERFYFHDLSLFIVFIVLSHGFTSNSHRWCLVCMPI